MISEKETLDEFDQLIKTRNLDGLLPFLQEKTEEHVEALRKHLVKAKRYWMTHVEVAKEPEFQHRGGNNSWATRGDLEQCAIIMLSALALMDKKGITSWDEPLWLFNEPSKHKILFEILEWAKPNWLDSYLLDRVKRNDWTHVDYQVLRLLEQRNLIAYNPELFAHSLSRPLNPRPDNSISKKEIQDQLDILLTDELTYKRDIPALFHYETFLHLYRESYRVNSQAPFLNFYYWEYLYPELLARKKMGLHFFIENALQIQTKDWNKNLKSFFRKRLTELNLLPPELLPFQEIIFTFFHAPYLPIVNYGVELCKQLHDVPGFKMQSFLEWTAALMLRADCKAAIKSLLPIFQKIAQSYPLERVGIAKMLADVFIIPDLALQERVAKLLPKLGAFESETFKEKLALYTPQMQGNIKAALSQWLDHEPKITEELVWYQQELTSQKLLQEPLNLPNSWNDILFQFGKFIHSDEPQEAEILLNTFICQQQLFPRDYQKQLRPYFKQLERTYFDAVFKNEIKAFLMYKMQDIKLPYSNHRDYDTELEALLIIKELTQLAERKIQQGSTLPLLSLPTHVPNWVAPKVLLERIIAHQKHSEPIDMADLSIAIARMPREEVEAALPLLPTIDESLRPLLSFCLGVNKTLQVQDNTAFSKFLSWATGNSHTIDNQALWVVAARTYYPNQTFNELVKTTLGAVPFVATPFRPEIYFKEQWNTWQNYQTKEIERSASWSELHFDKPEYKKIPSFLLYSLDLYRGCNGWKAYLPNPASVFYWHSIMPQNPEPLAFRLLTMSCTNSSDDTSGLKGFLSLLYRPEFWFSDPTYLVFATCFFQEKKDTRLLATEVLIHLIEQRKLDLDAFGEKIARLISEKYGVLLRCIDALMAIKDVSPLHNTALFMILDAVFKNLHIVDKLPANFKKLLENYLDMLVKTKRKPSPEAQLFLQKWQANTTLKKLINEVLKASL